mmetsp:Transcript_32948/g.48097  ORF Transcript_32948/g.48097 Transcript_32948/m.48097 type:complete len:147 (-) Transcript_32948:1238-1678(-)
MTHSRTREEVAVAVAAQEMAEIVAGGLMTLAVSVGDYVVIEKVEVGVDLKVGYFAVMYIAAALVENFAAVVAFEKIAAGVAAGETGVDGETDVAGEADVGCSGKLFDPRHQPVEELSEKFPADLNCSVAVAVMQLCLEGIAVKVNL